VLGEQAEDCESPAPHRTSVAPTSSERPVIMTLRTREHDLIVHGGDGGLRFSVAVADGTVVAPMLEAGDFEARFPELHQHFETAFAGEGTVTADLDKTPLRGDVTGWAGM
jgi:hypothetical protein